MAGSRLIRVYSVQRAGRVYACYRPTRRIWRLGNKFSDGSSAYGVEPLALAGRFVAWTRSEVEGSHGGGFFGVFALDARTGAVVRRWHGPAWDGPGSCDFYFGGSPRSSSIVVSPGGSIAWIMGHSRCSPHLRPTYEVWKSETSASKIEIAAGEDIDANSLRLEATQLSWNEAGSLRTATLSG